MPLDQDDALIIRRWWCTPGSPELGKLSQEDPKFKASLGYIVPFSKKRERDRKTTFLLSVHVHLRTISIEFLHFIVSYHPESKSPVWSLMFFFSSAH